MENEDKQPNEIEKLAREFLEYGEIEKNQSLLTIRNYEHYLSRFSEYAKSQGVTKMKDISLELVRTYRLMLNRMTDDKGKSLKTNTQNYHVIAIRAFLKYAAKRDFESLSPEKIELAKPPSRDFSVLTPDELKRILETCDREENEILRLRDTAILLTLFSSGVRVSELVSLKKEMINLETGEFTVLGKGDKLRLTFLSEDTIEAIRKYLKKRDDNHPALFLSHTKIGQSVTTQMDAMNGKKDGLTARTIQRIVRKYAMIAGITHKVSVHTFRHTFATDLLRNGADIRSVQTLLGHASINTTQIYTHVTNEQLRDVHKKFHNKKKED